jgi:hypothetical protein
MIDAVRFELAPVGILEGVEFFFFFLGELVADFRGVRAALGPEIAFAETRDEFAPKRILGKLVELLAHGALGEFLVGKKFAVHVGLDEVGAAESLGEPENFLREIAVALGHRRRIVGPRAGDPEAEVGELEEAGIFFLRERNLHAATEDASRRGAQGRSAAALTTGGADALLAGVR